MAGAQGSALAIAVCNAGGLGALPCAMLDPAAMRRELAALRAGTAAPYAVNFFSHTPPTPDADREQRWRELLAPYYVELGLDPGRVVAAPARVPFGEEAADALDEFEPPVVSFHFGLPAPPLVARVRRWGALVLATATTLDEARWLEARGVDAIVAQGIEAGGHRGNFLSDDLTLQPATRDLVARIVGAVKVPVIAAGGIADAAGVATVLEARRRRRDGWYGLSALPRSHHQRRAPRGARRPSSARDRVDQPVLGSAGARDRQPIDARAGPDLRRGAGISPRRHRRRAAASRGRAARQRRFLAAVGRGERGPIARGPRGRGDASAGVRDLRCWPRRITQYCSEGVLSTMIPSARATIAVPFLLLATLAPQTPTPKPVPIEDPDAYAVFAAVLPRERVKALVVRAETGMMQPCKSSGSEYEEWKQVVESYLRENAVRRVVLSRPPLVAPYLVVPMWEIEASFRAIEGDQFGVWAGFYERYPKSNGYAELSAVGFDDAKQRAMVYVGHHCGMLCGGGKNHLLEKVGGEWREVQSWDLAGCMWAN